MRWRSQLKALDDIDSQIVDRVREYVFVTYSNDLELAKIKQRYEWDKSVVCITYNLKDLLEVI
jgi:hypothetical protein